MILMKKLILIIFIFLVNIQVQASLVIIPDINFRAWLVINYPSCMIGTPGNEQLDTSCSDIPTVTNIDVSGQGIADLTGIQYFMSLQSLNCDNNILTTLPSLPNSLTLLVCRNNSLTSLPTLPNNLIRMFCSNNNLTSLPTLPNNLLELSCGENPLTSLPVLPNTLEELACNDALLTSLPTLPNSIIELQCSDNQITSLPALPPSLEELRCSNNQLSSLPSIPPMSALDFFICNGNKLDYGDLEPFISVFILFANPQNNFEISPNTFCSPVGSSFSIDGTVGGTANLYEWFKDGISLGSPSTNPILTVSSTLASDAGAYHVVVTSTFGFTPFTLPSIRSKNVVVETTTCALPISLLSFDITKLSDNTVKLSWLTASELNNAFFTLEKSSNALDFQVFQIIEGAGSSTEINTYEVIDEEPLEGLSYYRLKQTDFDGSYQYHTILSVFLEKNNKIKIYPNPVMDWLTVESLELCNIHLMNVEGKVLKKMASNSLQTSISFAEFNSGTYFLTIYLQDSIDTYRIIKK